MDNVRAKLAKEEAQSFHVALPHFPWHFLPGIHIAHMVWVWQKGKGHLCVDPSSTISSDDDGAANDSIPPPGLDGHEDECPSIYYSNALHHHLTQIWNLCIMYLEEDILQYCDDIQEAAFHRVLYHPDAMIVFTSVLQEFLIIPIGSIFGAHNSPSFFTLHSEGRSHVASNQTFRENDELENLTPIAQRIHLAPLLTPKATSSLVSLVPDSRHYGIQLHLVNQYRNSTFVDDNGIVKIW
jgi:hypothetical protein